MIASFRNLPNSLSSALPCWQIVTISFFMSVHPYVSLHVSAGLPCTIFVKLGSGNLN